MSFAYSAGVITQTGTDTDLSGLSGLTGVTVLGTSDYVIYHIDSARIDVQGTLTINPNIECLHFNSNALRNELKVSSGTLNIDGGITSGSVTIYSKNNWMITDQLRQDAFNSNGASLIVNSGGTLNWTGGVLQTYSVVSFENNSTVTFNNAIILQNESTQTQVKIETPNVAFNGPLSVLNKRVNCKNFSLLDQFTPQLSVVEFSNGTPVITNFNDADTNSSPYRIRSGVKTDIINNELGNAITIAVFPGTSVNGSGVARIYRRCDFSTKDSSDTAISGVKIYAKNYDDTNRFDHSATWGAGYDFTSDIEYNFTTDVSGLVSNEDILVKASSQPTTTDTSQETSDFTKSQNGSFDFFYCVYDKTLKTTNVDLIGSGDLSINEVLIDDLSVTESTKATVDAYTELETPEKFYDRAKAYLYDNYAGETSTIVSRSGNTINLGSYDLVIDATASPAFALAGNTITIHADTFTGNLTTTGTITLSNGAIVIGSYTDTSGTTTTLSYAITGLVANSRVQIYNVTTATEVSNAVVAGTSVSGTYNEGGDYTAGDSVRIRVTNVQGVTAYSEYQATVQATSAGWSALVSQELCVVYNTLGIDGSAITQFSADYVNDELDIDTAGNFTLADLYAWWKYNLYTEQGIREFYGGITAVDEGNFRINTAVLSIYLDNTTANDSIQTDNRRLYRDDGVRPVNQPTSGGGGVDVEWRSPVSLADTEAITADLAIIKTRTGLIPATV